MAEITRVPRCGARRRRRRRVHARYPDGGRRQAGQGPGGAVPDGGLPTTARAVSGDVPGRRPLLINRDFAKLWYGQAVSAAGDSMCTVTMVLWVSQVLAGGRSWAPAAAGGLPLAAGAAVALVGPAAGVFVDRWDRTLTMMRSEAARAVLAACFAGLSFIPLRDLPLGAWLAMAYLMVFVLNGAGQFFGPARLAVIKAVVPGEADQARAAGLAGAAQAAAGVIGPPAAAPLLFAAGVHWALAANAASYAVSFLAVRKVSLPPAPDGEAAAMRGGLAGEFAEGLRAFRSSRFLTSLLTVTVICQCGTGTVTALNVFFISWNLHEPARLLGVAEMTMAAGFAAGALAAGGLVRRVGARRLTWSGLLAAGVLVGAYAVQRSFPAGLAVLTLYGAQIAVLDTATTPLLLRAAPAGSLGRVMAVYSPVNQLASAVSIAIWGWLASTVLRGVHASVAGVSVDPASVLLIAGAMLITAAGIWALTALEAAPPPGPARSGSAPGGPGAAG